MATGQLLWAGWFMVGEKLIYLSQCIEQLKDVIAIPAIVNER
jgi:hypothetical protein